MAIMLFYYLPFLLFSFFISYLQFHSYGVLVVMFLIC